MDPGEGAAAGTGENGFADRERKVKNITLIGAYELGEFDTDEGWILEMWPEWKDPKVTYWMPLPEPPEEEKDEK